METHTKRRACARFIQDFLLKTKQININGQTSVGDSLTHTEFHETIDRCSITTATKIEINLVVTMISPWQAPIIIGR